MTAKPGGDELRLPPGLSPAEEADWWDEHPEFWDAVDTEYEVLPPQKVRRTMHINLWLPVDMVDALQQEAMRRSVSYQWLIRMWLEERLDSERKRSKGH